MPDIGIFDLLDVLERKGNVALTDKNSTYCDCCQKTHFRNWYRHERTGDTFYVCSHTMEGMINYRSGNWGRIALSDLVNHLL